MHTHTHTTRNSLYLISKRKEWANFGSIGLYSPHSYTYVFDTIMKLKNIFRLNIQQTIVKFNEIYQNKFIAFDTIWLF